jgi:hypothetical protein
LRITKSIRAVWLFSISQLLIDTGYCWQDEWEDRKWCLECEGSSCGEDDYLWIKKCDEDEKEQVRQIHLIVNSLKQQYSHTFLLFSFSSINPSLVQTVAIFLLIINRTCAGNEREPMLTSCDLAATMTSRLSWDFVLTISLKCTQMVGPTIVSSSIMTQRTKRLSEQMIANLQETIIRTFGL